MSSTSLESVRWMTLCQDLFEEGELHGIGILKNVAGDGIEWSHIHVTVGVEIVNEFQLIDVCEDEVTHGASLRL